MDPLILLLSIVVSILTILLVVVGIQVILILRHLKTTLTLLNQMLLSADTAFQAVAHPFHGLGDTMAGIKAGLSMAEQFVTWLKNYQAQHEPSVLKNSS